MAVTILDLAHDREGFERQMIDKLVDTLTDLQGIGTHVVPVHLSLDRQGPVAVVPPDTKVVVVVCHGEKTASPIVESGNVTFQVGDFYLDAEIEGAEALDAVPPGIRDGIMLSLRDPGQLVHFIAFPDEPFAVVWYVCNSDTADALLLHVQACRVAMSFLGAAYERQWFFVAEAVSELHAQLSEGGEMDESAFQDLRRWHGDSWNASVVFKRPGSLLMLPATAEG